MPGDKSISHRAAMIAALADGTSRLRNFSNSADCEATLSCLTRLGVSIERDHDDLRVHGAGAEGLRVPAEPLDCSNSGTTLRLLGAGISANDGRAPLIIAGRRPLKAIKYDLPIASAQVKSCLLLAGLNAEGRTEIVEHEVTRDHTERMLRWFGVPLETRDVEGSRAVAISGPARLSARDVSIPGDISSAAYFVAAAALLPDSLLKIAGVGLNPTRVLFLKQLQSLGLNVSPGEVWDEPNEPAGVLRVEGFKTRPSSESTITLRGSLIPQLIDELPLLAVVGSQIKGGIEIRDAAELRAKESDRIAATVQNLRAMGAEVEEFKEGLRVSGSARLRGALIDPHGDHRIAMAFSLAALIAQGETEIKDAECVAVSFPEFFELLDSVVER